MKTTDGKVYRKGRSYFRVAIKANTVFEVVRVDGMVWWTVEKMECVRGGKYIPSFKNLSFHGRIMRPFSHEKVYADRAKAERRAAKMNDNVMASLVRNRDIFTNKINRLKRIISRQKKASTNAPKQKNQNYS